MCCRRTITLICLLLVSCLSSHSQDTVLRIGVTLLRAAPHTVSGTEARDRLVKELNRHKRKKEPNEIIEAVPLENEWGVKAAAEARLKQCMFVLSTHLTDARTSSALTYNGAGSDLDYMPVFSATVEYSLIRVSDGALFHVASVKGDNSDSLTFATWAALSHAEHEAIVELEKRGNIAQIEKVEAARTGGSETSTVPDVFTVNNDLCSWLPGDFPHAEAVRSVCQFTNSVAQKMPNFICDQEASRYRGTNKVPFDLITSSVRYQDGREFYSSIKRNGQPISESLSQSPGLWSTGEFSSNNLRSIFDPLNHAIFQFLKNGSLNGRSVWIFSYRILKQNNPLWRLRTSDQTVAPPYGGELWIDQQTGRILHFDSAATRIPPEFSMESASQTIEYENVNFGEAGFFLLPTSFVVATRSRGEEATRNVVRFRNCHEFRATSHIVLNVPSNESENSAANLASSAADAKLEFEEAERVYVVLREQAIRDDDAAIEAERRLEMNVATVSALSRLARMEKIREKRAEQIAANTPAAHAPSIETTLKVSVRLVPVTVVLRDSKGKAVGDFRKEDFSLFDNGAPQPIKSFVVEQSKNVSTPAPALQRTQADSTQTLAKDTPPTPARYVAYLFDDIHTSFEDLASTRTAASHRVDALRPEDRVAIVTTSGQVFQDFTSDRGKLDQSLQALRPHPIIHGPMCPPISPYMADLIVNQGDREALGLATRDALNCAFGGMGAGPELARAEQIAKSTAFEVLSTSASEGQSVLSGLRSLVQQMGHMPGSRSIVLISPGFLTSEVAARQGVADLIETALRSEIVVNTLDVRGLYTPVASPNSTHPANPVARFKFDREESSGQSEILANLAYSTGGTFFHSNNDLDEGFRRTTEAPEYVYVLGFSPAKLDGKYHKLKVRLNTQSKLTIQAREGYYALKSAPEPAKLGNPQ